jgi:hypothetical protein
MGALYHQPNIGISRALSHFFLPQFKRLPLKDVACVRPGCAAFPRHGTLRRKKVPAIGKKLLTPPGYPD